MQIYDAWPLPLQRKPPVVKEILVLSKQEPTFSSGGCEMDFVRLSLVTSLMHGGDINSPIFDRLYDLILDTFVSVESSLPKKLQ